MKDHTYTRRRASLPPQAACLLHPHCYLPVPALINPGSDHIRTLDARTRGLENLVDERALVSVRICWRSMPLAFIRRSCIPIACDQICRILYSRRAYDWQSFREGLTCASSTRKPMRWSNGARPTRGTRHVANMGRQCSKLDRSSFHAQGRAAKGRTST